MLQFFSIKLSDEIDQKHHYFFQIPLRPVL